MTWTKISDGFLDDLALSALPRGARLLHVEAMIFCNRAGTDGLVPTRMLRRITDEDDPAAGAAALVAAGKWVPAADGWEIVGFLDDQPSAADVERVQEMARERQRRQRQHRSGDHSLCDPRYCHARERSPVTRDETSDSRVTNGVSHDSPTRPTRSVRTKGSVRGEDGDGSAAGAADRPASAGKNWRRDQSAPGEVYIVTREPIQ